ncbi:MAG: c-type cytochrome [Candidatus Eremiobacteraeota bacterium]|nr:c-type cytochrome [Candidatus Eremiobacteraeota bacterium]
MLQRSILILVTGLFLSLTITACSKPKPNSTTSTSATDAKANKVTQVADVDRGRAVYAANCVSCHGANGAGGGVGPALKNEKLKKKMPAVISWIKNPQPPMPKLYPSPLSEKDVSDVAAYVESL